MLQKSSLLFGSILALADTLVIIGGGFRIYLAITKKLDRIHYAIFNDGNGMKQQVEDLHKNQQAIKTDIAVLRTEFEAYTVRPVSSRRK